MSKPICAKKSSSSESSSNLQPNRRPTGSSTAPCKPSEAHFASAEQLLQVRGVVREVDRESTEAQDASCIGLSGMRATRMTKMVQRTCPRLRLTISMTELYHLDVRLLSLR